MQVTDPHGLRDGTFDACPDGIGFFERFGPLPLSCSLQCEIEGLWAKRQGACSCLGTLPTTRAEQTVSGSKPDVDDLLSKAILGERPRTTQLSSGASDR